MLTDSTLCVLPAPVTQQQHGGADPSSAHPVLDLQRHRAFALASIATLVLPHHVGETAGGDQTAAGVEESEEIAAALRIDDLGVVLSDGSWFWCASSASCQCDGWVSASSFSYIFIFVAFSILFSGSVVSRASAKHW